MKTTENEVMAVYEPVRLAYKPKITEEIKITESSDAYKYLRPIFEEAMSFREIFVILLLNRANNILGHAVIGMGGKYSTTADPGLILQHMLLANAYAVILAHNHPSGHLAPSDQDRKITHNIAKAAKYIDLSVFDHLILTEATYYSFADNYEKLD